MKNSKEDKIDENLKEQKAEEEAEKAAEATSEKAEEQKPEEKKPEEPKENKELSDMKDKYIRLAADFDNYKKRTVKESETKYLDAKAETIKKFLPIVDNFERALKHEAPEEAKAYVDGVKMIYDMLLKTLKENNVEEIDALNQTFDPEKHFAVMHVEDENFGANTVCEVFEKGYKMGDRILRYSMVKVAN